MQYSKNLSEENTEVLIIGGGPAGLCAAIAAARTGAKYAVPVHIGMFDNFTNAAFLHPNKITPTIYEEIVFGG